MTSAIQCRVVNGELVQHGEALNDIMAEGWIEFTEDHCGLMLRITSLSYETSIRLLEELFGIELTELRRRKRLADSSQAELSLCPLR
ncbi:MAG: hypothetical protein EFT35_01380 [Methanophagales archaeon ANME-1-THS]|nr:MAG: hypothetical protein EFT35_01380 [Methanophagales archaeon ANME-1-THS]